MKFTSYISIFILANTTIMLVVREIQYHIQQTLFKGKVIIIYGARRVGKTTLVKQILKKYPESKYINCELLQNKTALETTNSEILKDIIGPYKLVVLDEVEGLHGLRARVNWANDVGIDRQIVENAETGGLHAPQQVARREMEGAAIFEILVAQDPARARRPGEHPKRRRIGQNGRGRPRGRAGRKCEDEQGVQA